MKFYKRNEKWGVDLVIESKRVRRSGFRTKAEAQTVGEKLLRDGVETSQSFEKYYINWIETYKKDVIKDRSYKWYLLALDIFLKSFGKNVKIKDVSKIKYQKMLNDYAATHAHSSVRKLNNCLKAVFTDAHAEGHIVRNPTRNAKINAKVATQSDESKYITEFEHDKLLNAVMNSDKTTDFIIFLLMITGARYQEVRDLKVENILVDEKSIHLKGTKSETANRIVRISDHDIDYIVKKLETWPIEENGDLFKISHTAVHKALKLLIRNLDIKTDISLHGLRHTHASILLKEKIDINYISQRLGHSNKSITLNVYSHLLDEQRINEENKTADILNKKYENKLKSVDL